jgi:hydroxypyruvate isomerase
VIWSAHLSMLFRELPYLDRPQAAAEAGFTAVETWWPDSGLGPSWADETVRHGLAVSLLNAYGGDIEAGERGFLNVADRRAEAIDAFRAAADLAHRCGAPRINVLVGRETPGRPRESQLADAAATLAACAEIAEEEDLTVLVEPINDLDVPGSLVPNPAAAVDLIESTGSPTIRLLYDEYHAARAGGDPCSEVASMAKLIAHVHYADCPGRGAPGTGEIDLGALVAALEAAGYRGAVGLEFDPGGPTGDALGFLAR